MPDEKAQRTNSSLGQHLLTLRIVSPLVFFAAVYINLPRLVRYMKKGFTTVTYLALGQMGVLQRKILPSICCSPSVLSLKCKVAYFRVSFLSNNNFFCHCFQSPFYILVGFQTGNCFIAYRQVKYDDTGFVYNMDSRII